MGTGGLSRWFNENWVDLSRPKKGGGYEPCGRTDASEGKYPKCVPASRAARMTPEEIKSAIQRKRRAESTQTREDKKPIMVATVKKENVPADMELYNRVKAEAKRKFDVYPSAYANGWLVQEYKRRGGKYKTGKVDKVSRMSADLWSSGEGGFIGPALGNVVALGEGRQRVDYDTFVGVRKKVVKNFKSMKSNRYQRERFKKETSSDGRSGGELGRGNNEVRARRKMKILKEWGNGKSAPCVYCGAKLNYQNLELEKLVPEIGYDTFENLAPACRKCNASMYSKSFTEKIRMVAKDSPTTSDVHVPAVMGSRKKRELQKKKMAMEMAIRKASNKPLKDPKGGLTAAGRAKFNRETGSKLKPGVRGPADTPEKMKRKGSFLTRFFTNPSGPMVGENGKPTRLALSAAAWGEPVPKNRSDAAKLAEKGRNLLERYEKTKMSKHGSHDQSTHAARGARGGRRMVEAKPAPKKATAKKPSPMKGKPRPKAPTKAGDKQLKTRLTAVDARSKKAAAKVADYMSGPVSRFKNPNVRRYAQARVTQMTGGTARPSGMSKKYGLDKKQVIATEMVLSKIFRAGRERFSI